MGKCIIRCNVNNLLLSVIVLESIFLGWFLLGLFLGPAALFPYSKEDRAAKASGNKVVKGTLRNVVKVEEDVPEPWELVYGLLIGAGVLFVIQLKALVLLVVGYKRQNHKPLGVYLLWLILSNLFYIVLLALAIVYAYDLPQYLTHPYAYDAENPSSGRKKRLHEFIDQKPLVKILRSTMDNFNYVTIPLLIFKGFFVVYEIIALICAIRYFKRLREEGFNDETNKFIES